MGNTKFNISRKSKDCIDSLKVMLDINETPIILKLSLAKGIATYCPSDQIIREKSDAQWTVPENIIKDNEYLLFKHIIINEHKLVITDQDINKYFSYYIEMGLTAIDESISNKTSFEDIRLSILT